MAPQAMTSDRRTRGLAGQPGWNPKRSTTPRATFARRYPRLVAQPRLRSRRRSQPHWYAPPRPTAHWDSTKKRGDVREDVAASWNDPALTYFRAEHYHRPWLLDCRVRKGNGYFQPGMGTGRRLIFRDRVVGAGLRLVSMPAASGSGRRCWVGGTSRRGPRVRMRSSRSTG